MNVPGIRDRIRVRIVNSIEGQHSSTIGCYKPNLNQIEVIGSLDKDRRVTVFWHEVWHMLESEFKGIKDEELKSDMFCMFMYSLIGPEVLENMYRKFTNE